MNNKLLIESIPFFDHNIINNCLKLPEFFGIKCDKITFADNNSVLIKYLLKKNTGFNTIVLVE